MQNIVNSSLVHNLKRVSFSRQTERQTNKQTRVKNVAQIKTAIFAVVNVSY